MVDKKLRYAVEADVQQMQAALKAVGADVQELTRKLKEQAKTGTAGSAEMIAEVQRLRTVMQGIGRTAAAEVQVMDRSMGAMRNTVQNAAFQVGDFAVQVASGTSASRAFAQQAPQLLGAFGMWGAIVGAAAAALVPLIGNLISTAEEGDEAAERLQGLITALQSFREYSELAATSVEDLQSKFGRFAGQMREDAQWMAQVSLGEARRALSENAAGMAEDFRKLEVAQRNAAMAAEQLSRLEKEAGGGAVNPELILTAREALEGYLASVEDVLTGMGLTAEQAKALRASLESLESAKGMAEIADAAQAAKTAIRDMFPDGEVPPVVLKILDSMDNVLEEAALGVVAFEEVGQAAEGVGVAINAASDAMATLVQLAPGADWLNGAISGANRLAGAIRSAVAARVAAQAAVEEETVVGDDGKMVRKEDLYAGMAGRGLQPEAVSSSSPPAADSRSSGGGAGAVSEMDRLRQSATAALASVSTAQGEIAERVKAGLMTTGEGVKALRDAKVAAANDLAELAAAFEAQGTDAGRGMAAQLRGEIETVTRDIGGMFDELADKMSAAFTDPFADFLVGAKSAKDALNDFGQSIVKIFAQAAAQSVTTNLMQPLMSSFLGGIGFAQGGVIPFAKGGLPGISAYEGQIVNRPTMFAMGGGETGLMGEAGAEAIMPLTRMADGTLGVRAQPNPLVQWAKENAWQFEPNNVLARVLGSSAMSGLSSSSASAAVAQGQGGGAMVVNIQPPAGYEATTQTRQEGGANVADVVFKQIDNSMARGVMRGDSALANALAQSFGLTRKPK